MHHPHVVCEPDQPTASKLASLNQPERDQHGTHDGAQGDPGGACEGDLTEQGAGAGGDAEADQQQEAGGTDAQRACVDGRALPVGSGLGDRLPAQQPDQQRERARREERRQPRGQPEQRETVHGGQVEAGEGDEASSPGDGDHGHRDDPERVA